MCLDAGSTPAGSTFDTHHDLRLAGLRQFTRSVMMFVTVMDIPRKVTPLFLAKLTHHS